MVVTVLLGGVASLLPAAVAAPAGTVTLDDVTARKIDELLAAKVASGARSRGELIELLSRQFLGTPYGADMLIGSATEPEQLVVDFRRVDCFTLLDYVEALSRSSDRDQFLAELVNTRYAGGTVDFTHRKHFFTDWAATPRVAATDITSAVSPAAVTVTQHLNAKAGGGNYLPGIPVVDRDITYIPASAVDDAVVGQLRTGDYVGAYADQAGLDVTHVGIVVQTPNGPVFRNASSLDRNEQVVDSPFDEYVRSTPGIVVMRPA
nr:DUF1460 domain-containing protein [Nocardia transvalensis]